MGIFHRAVCVGRENKAPTDSDKVDRIPSERGDTRHHCSPLRQIRDTVSPELHENTGGKLAPSHLSRADDEVPPAVSAVTSCEEAAFTTFPPEREAGTTRTEVTEVGGGREVYLDIAQHSKEGSQPRGSPGCVPGVGLFTHTVQDAADKVLSLLDPQPQRTGHRVRKNQSLLP